MTIHRRRRGTRSSGRRGQALVEFALVIPIFLLLLMALFDMGRAVFAYNTLTNAAREGARIAIVNQDVTSITDRAKAQTQIVELDDPSITIQFRKTNTNGTPDMSSDGDCSPAAVGCLAVVSFQATYHPITPLISNIVFGSGVTFTAKSQLSVEYSCPNATFAAADCPKQP